MPSFTHQKSLHTSIHRFLKSVPASLRKKIAAWTDPSRLHKRVGQPHYTKRIKNSYPDLFQQVTEFVASQGLSQFPATQTMVSIARCIGTNHIEGYSCSQCGDRIYFGSVCSEACLVASTQTTKVRRKRKSTTLERYGVANVAQCPEIKAKFAASCSATKQAWSDERKQERLDKFEATMIEKYGEVNACHVPKLLDRKKATLMARLGVDNPGKSEKVKAKIKATTFERYGVENIFAHPEVIRQVQESKKWKSPYTYRYKDYYTKDGVHLRLQGYEPIVAAKMESRGWLVRDGQVISIPYTDKNGKRRQYFPDLVGRKGNHRVVVEVKSSYTATQLDPESVIAKACAARRWCKSNRVDYVLSIATPDPNRYRLMVNPTRARLMTILLAGG